MNQLTIAEQTEFGLAPAGTAKKLEGLLLAAEGIATRHCPSAQNTERLYTDRMRFAIYTLARAIDASFAANPANNVTSESSEGYSYSLAAIDFVGSGAVTGALKLVAFACQNSGEPAIGTSVRGRRTKCHCRGDSDA